MDKKIKLKKILHEKRKKRVRKKINGTTERPRVTVNKSARNLYIQVVDDVLGKTLVSASTYEKGTEKSKSNLNKNICGEVGKVVAARCKEKNISKVVFDKNGYRYHGKIKALADSMREAGLIF